MDIKSLINPTPSISSSRPIVQRRKRNDPVPIWAIREQDAPWERAPPQVPSHAPSQQPLQVPAEFTPQAQNGLHDWDWQPSITGKAPYDEISRTIGHFIWHNMITNDALLQAAAESEGSQVEIEAKWGQIQDFQTKERLRWFNDTECILRTKEFGNTRFASTMSVLQHKKMNQYLNNSISANLQQNGDARQRRSPLSYKHIYEKDEFYDLDQDGFNRLLPSTRSILGSPRGQKVRVTKDSKTNLIIRKIIKHKIANVEISSPQTEWDYRISINLEIQYPGSVEDLSRAVEKGKVTERSKDRMSYAHNSQHYQIDLTQVVNVEGEKNHELELEVDSMFLLMEAEKVKSNQANHYDDIIGGMINNLRELSRAVGR
ncbi:mRNA triphosphatase CET1 [Lepidopterella palustris CBS 459.81]|uniref:mRNA-capping enzyme subunit beta n=1 Tax=Lepidopterella palustris CBS 459.81 TaxID=1314670 RepID=A0A8E2E6W4_9PEZI|nr:mRNA triphosphatase CET1 [Lepidopterella palustris CBS 459.81]